MQRNLMDKLYKAIKYAAQTVTATGVSSSQDVKDLMSLSFLVALGAMAFDGSNLLTFKLQESDDDSTWTDCTVANGGAYEADIVANSSGFQNSVQVLEYRGSKKYARVAWTETGTVSVPMSVVAIGTPKNQPPA